MKKLNYIWGTLFLGLTLLGCSDSPTNSSSNSEASAEKQFVWNAMNYWYYWQDDVPELADDHFSNNQELQDYLKNFSDAETVLNELVYEQDDFSFFIEDYEEFQESQQGISESFGYEFGLVRMGESNNLFGYVQYIVPVPNSPAEEAGLVRGDLFTKIDGTRLTINNYQDLLLGTTSYQLGMAAIQENNSIEETGETVDLQAISLQEDPVFISKVLQENSTQIGYLMYNAFQTNSHKRLNDEFGTFQSEGIDELVIDLRYNGGGAGITTQMLAGMISGLDDSNKFATYSYNTKRSSNWNRTVNILDEVPIYEDGERSQEEPLEMNQLMNLDHVYVLVDRGTASASELLINALKPYMEVTLIGRRTIGKDEGSYTLYDAPAPYLSEEDASPDHMYAIQPIVLKLVNKDGLTYPNGFTPEHEVNELVYLQDRLPPLGDKNDPLLAKAIELITGQPPAKIAQSSALPFDGEMIKDSRDLKPYAKRLYLQPPQQLPN